VRPSYVLGGRAMEIVYSDKDLHRYINTAVEVRSWHASCLWRLAPVFGETGQTRCARARVATQGWLTPAVAAVHALHLTS